MTDPLRTDIVSSARLIVVKVGTRVLTGPDGLLDDSRIETLGRQLAAILSQGRQVVLVSSGAVGAGMGRMGLSMRPQELAHLQAVAAIGQSCLIEAYERVLRGHSRHAAQVLLVADDFKDRARYLNIRNTLRALLDYEAIPIINENDTVSVEELRTSFGDNDRLAALVATLLGAPLLVLLSDVEGLFDRHPSDPTASRLTIVPRIDAAVASLARDRAGGLSKGGMASKIAAAEIVTEAGTASSRRAAMTTCSNASAAVKTLARCSWDGKQRCLPGSGGWAGRPTPEAGWSSIQGPARPWSHGAAVYWRRASRRSRDRSLPATSYRCPPTMAACLPAVS